MGVIQPDFNDDFCEGQISEIKMMELKLGDPGKQVESLEQISLRSSCSQMFFKICILSQYSQENTCAGVSF